jgi:hypothetical protein
MKCAAELHRISPKAVIIKDDRAPRRNSEYDLSRLSDEQLLTLHRLLAAASHR